MRGTGGDGRLPVGGQPTIRTRDTRTGFSRLGTDIALGVRLVFAAGRGSVARLALSTVGIGLVVAVLLGAASLVTAVDNQVDRRAERGTSTTPVAGRDPLHVAEYRNVEFHGDHIGGSYVHAPSGNTAVPPGVARVPGEGEVVVSPALADLLGSPEGEQLRPRFDQRIVGVIGDAGLIDPGELYYYAGAGQELMTGARGNESDGIRQVYAFGAPADAPTASTPLIALTLVGTVVLLVPLLVFVATSSRVAGAERDRRLAAIRLVGGGRRQVVRIAAAESLVSGLAGLVLGTAVFLVGRQFAERLTSGGVFVQDMVPPLPLAVAITVLVPGIGMLTTTVALRRTIIEPLGVVRRGKPVRRGVWWRFAVPVLGVGLLWMSTRYDRGSSGWGVSLAVGVTLLLVAVPVLLPWLTERVVRSIHGGPPSWQLAVRRLQLDSGTPSRVVSGVAVVLSGVIALQALMGAVAGAEETSGPSERTPDVSSVVGAVPEGFVASTVERLREVPGVTGVGSYQRLVLAGNDRQPYRSVLVASCDYLRAEFGAKRCVDGDAFAVAGGEGQEPPKPGSTVRLEFLAAFAGEARALGSWTVPRPRTALPTGGDTAVMGYPSMLATPGAMTGVRLADASTEVLATVPQDRPHVLEAARNAFAPLGWRTSTMTYNDRAGLVRVQRDVAPQVERALLVGAVFTLSLAGLSLLVLGLEQIRERRRSLAMLTASGVSSRTLVGALLWQHAIPVSMGVVIAAAVGIALGAFTMASTELAVVLDWAAVGWLSLAALALVFVVTVLTLPSLRGAIRMDALRTE